MLQVRDFSSLRTQSIATKNEKGLPFLAVLSWLVADDLLKKNSL